MADHNKPTSASTYAQVLSEYDGRLKDMAAAFDPAYATVANIPANTVRWSSAAKKWQYWTGTAWIDLASEYAISISGTAPKLKTARTFQISGGATAAAVNFDGSGNVNLNVTGLDGTKLNNVVTSSTDTTAGHIANVGWLGLGALNAPTVTFGSEADWEKPAGWRAMLNSASTGLPIAGYWYAECIAHRNQSGGTTWLLVSHTDGTTYVGKADASTAYPTWKKQLSDADLTTSSTDMTAGRILKVRDFGIGLGGAGQIIVDNVDRLDLPTGLSRVTNTTTGTFPPNSGSHYGTLFVEAYSLANGVESFCQTFTRAFITPQRWFRYYAFNLISGAAGWSPWARLLTDADIVDPWASYPIGLEFPLAPNVSAPPTNDPSFRYIALVAGLTGTGGYNQGVLTSETVTGSDPTITATAVVSLTGSPLNGKTIDLIGTSRAFIRPGPAAAAIVNSQNAAHTHSGSTNTAGAHTHPVNGLLTANAGGSNGPKLVFQESIGDGAINAASAGDHSHSLTINSSGGSEAAPRHIARVFYMRIK